MTEPPFDNIVPLTTQASYIPGRPPKAIIEYLEYLLVCAKRGDVMGIAVAWADGGDRVRAQHFWGLHPLALLAAIDFLHHDMLMDMDSKDVATDSKPPEPA